MQNAVAFGASQFSGVLLSNGSCRKPRLQNASVWRFAFKETCLVCMPSSWDNSSLAAIRKGPRFRLSIIVSSSLEEGRTCPQPGLKTTKVKFVLQKECSFGQSFNVVGDTPELGAWEASSGIPMTWSDGHIWTVDLDLPQGKRFEYKFLLRDPHTVEWQPGPNWVIPKEEDHLDSSNGNVATGEEEFCRTQSLEGQYSLDESAHYSAMENMEDTKVLALEDETLDQEKSSKVKYIEEETVSKTREGSKNVEDIRRSPQSLLQKNITRSVKFVLQKECSFGQNFSVVGDTPELGAWDASSGVPMTWSDGHIWSVDLELPRGKRIEYKFLLIKGPHTVEWQQGPNRVFITHNNLYFLTVSQPWDFDGYADLRTQVIPQEEDHLDSSNGNVAIGEEELCSTHSLDESAHYSDIENMEDTKVLALDVCCNLSDREIQEQVKLGIQQEDVVTSSTTSETRFLNIHGKLASSIVQDETLDQEESSKIKYIEEETVSKTREGSKSIEDISSPPQSLLQKNIARSVKFVLQKECSFGQHFSVVGDTPELGAWEASSGIPMTWSDGHIWSVDLELPQGKRFEYKFLLIRDPHTVEWQPGPNRVFITRNDLYSLTVSQSWDFDEYADLKTQVIPQEEDHLDSSDGNVAIGEEELCSTQSLEGQFSLDESAHYSDMENMEDTNMEDTKVLALEVQCNSSNHDIQEQLKLGIQQDVITSSTTGETRLLGIHDKLASSIVQDETLDQEESSSASKIKYIEEEIVSKTREGSKIVEDISSLPQSLLQKNIAWSVKALSNLLGSFGLLKIDEKP